MAGDWVKRAIVRLRGFASATRGNVAMIFALSLPGLVFITLGGVDIHRASTVRVNLQDALDAAALAAARSEADDAASIQRIGLAALKANLKAYPEITLREDQTHFTLNEDNVVIADSKVDVKTLVANVVLPPYGKFMDDKLPVGAHSEVNRSSKNLEVSMVLDVTGSMDDGRIEALKAAALDLVKIVVKDDQTPYYSKMAIVPYSMGVNVGSYANTARGTPTAGRSITGAAWKTGSQKNLNSTSINRNSQATVSANGHGFQNGDFVWLTNVTNMSGVTGRAWQVSDRASNTFKLKYPGTNTYLNTSGYSLNGLGGQAQECLVSDCSVVVTANAHGLSNDEYVYIDGVRGMTQINQRGYQVGHITTNTYSIGVNGASWGTYSSGGTSFCGQYGCQWRVFVNAESNLRWFETSTCVSERTGVQAYTDAYTSAAKVGFNYPSSDDPNSGNACPESTILPLTASRSTLNSKINGLEIIGSTAGQIGAAWGWYTVAPSFSPMWAGSGAGTYDEDETLKAVIIMTDGEFNTPYCSGVIAQDAGSGSGDNRDHINCDATNGDPFDQTLSLCAGMKAKKILVYTVGFMVAQNGRARPTLTACATGPEYVHFATSAGDLKDAFTAIGRDITSLRISR